MANIIDSYSESNFSSNVQMDNGGVNFNRFGQSFTGNGSAVGSAAFYIDKSASPTGNAFAEIYAHTGTFGTTGKPTGSPLATSDAFDISTLTTSNQLITFNFSGANQIILTNATHYVVIFDISGASATSPNNLSIGIDTTSPTAGGNRSGSTDGSTWSTSSAQDVCFYVYDNAGAIIPPFNFIAPATRMIYR